jgi:Leucine-rich repeat (LRR) protein
MDIKCEYKTLKWADDKERYSCFVTTASITNPNISIKAFIGNHVTGKTNEDVEGILFQNTKVEYFPRGLHLFFPHLKCLKIINCGLKKIFRRDLNGFENLVELDLDNNQISTLPRNLLVNMKQLKIFIVRNNKLEFVSSQMLQPLVENKASRVSFFGNPKINDYYNSKHSLSSVVSLEALMKQIDEKCNKPIENPHDDDFYEFQKDFTIKLWETGKFSDFVVIAAERQKEFRVHKSVLGLRSSAFEEMFENNPDQTELKIESLKVESIEEFLRFIYTGKTSEKFNTKEVFALAAKFKVEALKCDCEEMILNELDRSNAFKTFYLGHRYSSHDLKRSAFEEIKKMLPYITLNENLIDEPEEMKKLEEMYRSLALFSVKKQ